MAMHSLLVGSIAKPSSHASFAVSAELSSVTNVKVSRCTAWSSLGRYHVTSFKNLLAENHVRSIEKRSLPFLRCSRSHLVVAFSGQSLKSGPEAFSSRSSWNYLTNVLDAFYRFSRPHTVIGTALSIVSVSLLAVKNLSDISPVFFTGMLQAIVAALFMNIYIVGLNQLFDIEIDKVNKPYLPLASGEYSVGTGVFIVASFAVLSFWLGHIVGSWPLFWALFVSFILGTAYSINLPMLRWKRFALVAAMCILAVRAVIVQIAFFLHMQMHVYGRPAVFSRPLIFATAFMSFFSVVIALFKLDEPYIDKCDLYVVKIVFPADWALTSPAYLIGLPMYLYSTALPQDIPDIEGDRIFGIRSFTVRLGQKRVFWICISLLEMAYAVAIAVGASSSFLWSKAITVVGHVILAAFLLRGAQSVDLNNKAAITSFYMFIWKLFYAEYLLIPLVR